MKRVLKNGHVMLNADETFNRFDVEAWIIGKLGNPPEITEGITTFQERRQRIYQLLIERDLANTPATAKTKQTWAQVYERFYGEPLTAKQPKGKQNVLPA